MAENPYSILNLDPDAFVAALDELGLQGEERKFLTDQYFAQSRALPMTERPEGKTVRTILPIATPEGMTGAEALMSGDFDFTMPEILRGLYEAPAEAINVASAIGKGVPVTEEQVQRSGQVVPEMITGIGPATFAAKSLARGVEMPDPSVISMSGVGPRGMGDNQGPPLEDPALEMFDEDGLLRMDDVPAAPPKRFINPETGLYSPSYEAAKALPQEVGTAQQMRSMLLKAGAKEEELTYSGFDNWLKGKDKVTKQEIEDILGSAAASVDNFGANSIYSRISNTAPSGATGASSPVVNTGILRFNLEQQRVQKAKEERNNALLEQLRELGYRPLQFADEKEFLDLTNQLRDRYKNRRTEFSAADFTELPRAEVREALFEAQDLMNSTGLAFDSPQVQALLQPLTRRSAIGVANLIGPRGEIVQSTGALSAAGRKYSNNDSPFFDDISLVDRDRIRDEIENMPLEQLAESLGLDAEEFTQVFDPGRTSYGKYVVPGMRNYSENQYVYGDEGRGVLSGIERQGASSFYQTHFGGGRKPLMFFTLTGELKTPEGPAYHLAQLQSDIGQKYADSPDKFFVPGKAGDSPAGKTAALPFSTSTNRWLDAAFKSELINAAKAGAEWVTIPKGDDVQKYTYGNLAGQRKFYGGPEDRGIAPMRLKNLVQKFIPFETEFKDIKATGYGPAAREYDVFGMRLTPEIRKFLLEEGLPSFAKGGPVQGSSLDVDVFALR